RAPAPPTHPGEPTAAHEGVEGHAALRPGLRRLRLEEPFRRSGRAAGGDGGASRQAGARRRDLLEVRQPDHQSRWGDPRRRDRPHGDGARSRGDAHGHHAPAGDPPAGRGCGLRLRDAGPRAERDPLAVPLPGRRRGPAQSPYLNDTFRRARYDVTLPFSMVTSSRETSPTRRSRSVLPAVCTAFLTASSHDTLLVPTRSVTR